MELNGTGALVIGGASGLGAATARALAERGARVAVIDLDGERAEALAAELDGGAVAHRADVTDAPELEAAIVAVTNSLGGLGLAVSCAGVGWAEKVLGRDGPAQPEPFERVVSVNLIGPSTSCVSPRPRCRRTSPMLTAVAERSS